MNLFRLILAMYFVVLSVMPCEDIQPQLGFGKTELLFNTDNSHSKDKGDICSPLCICNCCQITVANFKMDVTIIASQGIKAYFSKKILFQKNDFAYQVYNHIWQPPKI